MAEVDVQKLEGALARLETMINTANTLTDCALIRTYVAEAALAHLISNKAIDFDELETIMATEFKGGKRERRARDAVKDLRKRVGDPSVPQLEDDY